MATSHSRFGLLAQITQPYNNNISTSTKYFVPTANSASLALDLAQPIRISASKLELDPNRTELDPLQPNRPPQGNSSLIQTKLSHQYTRNAAASPTHPLQAIAASTKKIELPNGEYLNHNEA
jgi:hypothetical protein